MRVLKLSILLWGLGFLVGEDEGLLRFVAAEELVAHGAEEAFNLAFGGASLTGCGSARCPATVLCRDAKRNFLLALGQEIRYRRFQR